MPVSWTDPQDLVLALGLPEPEYFYTLPDGRALPVGAPAPGPTPQQRAAIEHPGGRPARILAGAGTGKTTVIVGRFHHLVSSGVKPERILALTFSREAARAMRDAILPGLTAAARLWINTFHSFCLRVLEEEGEAGLRLVQEGERQALLAAAAEGQTWSHYVGGRRPLLVPEALTFISHAKDYLLTPDDTARYAVAAGDLRLADLARLYDLYQAGLAQQGAAEFPDFITRAVLLLSQPEVGERWRGRFDHILVDEFQDTNLAQFRVLQILAASHGNLVVVGDDDQAIYHFRGASDRYLVRLPEHYANAETYQVEENFRCPPAVLTLANSLIPHNAGDRLPKQLFSTRDPAADPPVAHWEAQNERAEAEAVAAEIAERMQRGVAAPGDFAILCRSLRRTGPEFARALARHSIPYRMVGQEGPHPVILQTLALLRLIRRVTAADLLPVLASRLAPADLCAALREGKGDLAALMTNASGPAAFRAAAAEVKAWLAAQAGRPLPNQVWDALRYLGHVQLSVTPTAADLDRLAAARQLQEQAAQAPDLDGLLLACESGSGSGGPARAQTAADAVTLMTVHAAKGLEFPVVFVTGLVEGLFPVAVDSAPVFYTAEAIRDWVDGAGQSSVPDAAQRLLQHIREERRLAYVALTRARRELILTRARQYGQESAEPSRFLAEMGAPEPSPADGRLADPLPDARAYLVRVGEGVEPALPERVAEAVQVLTSSPQAVPLRRQEPPAPFRGDEPLCLSATALEAYRECPRRYYYGQVLRLPDEDNIALAFGDAVHGTMERYHVALQAGRNPSAADLDGWWEQSLDRSRCQSAGQYRQLLQRGRTFLRRYHAWAEGRWQKVVSVEERFEVDYTDRAGRTHRLVGRYDLIAEDAAGTIHVIDFKTGKRDSVVNKRITKGSEKNPDRKLQLGLYYLARFGGEVAASARVTYIFLRHTKDKYPAGLIETFDEGGEQVIGTSHTAESLAAIRAIADEAIEGILANRFDRTTDESKCRMCSFKDVCEVSPNGWF